MLRALLLLAMVVPLALPALLAPLESTRLRLEACLAALLGGPVRVQEVSYRFPLGYSLMGVTSGALFEAREVLVHPVVWTLIGRPIRPSQVAFLDAKLSASGAPCLAMLASQPADRLPLATSMERGRVQIPVSGREFELLDVQAQLTARTPALREFVAEFKVSGAPWKASGTLRPLGDGSLKLDAVGRTASGFDLPLPMLQGNIRIPGEAIFALHGRLQGRELSSAWGKLEAPAATVRSQTLGELQVRKPAVSLEGERLRLDETTLTIGGTDLRLRASISGPGPTEVTIEGDRIGRRFPKPPEAGEPVLSAGLTLAGKWPSPRLKARVRLMSGTLPRGVSQLEVEMTGDLDLVDWKLTNARIGGLINARPFTLTGSVTVPPWEPRNPLLSVRAELPRVDAALLDLAGAELEATGGESAEFGFRGAAKGPLRSLHATGELKLTRGPFLEMSEFISSIEMKRDTREGPYRLWVHELKGTGSDGGQWRTSGPVEFVLDKGRFVLSGAGKLVGEGGKTRELRREEFGGRE